MFFPRSRPWLIALLIIALLTVAAPWRLHAQSTPEEAPSPIPSREADSNRTFAFRMTWGGGMARTWHVTVTPSSGEIRPLQPLGLNPSVPGSSFVDQDVLRVESHAADTFGGIDFELSTSPDAEIAIQLFCDESPDVGFRRTVELRELLSGRLAAKLDDTGNRVNLTRVPGDELHIAMSRSHLVFRPQEQMRFDIVPRLPKNAFRSTPRLRVSLHAARDRRSNALWSREYSVEWNKSSGVQPIRGIELNLPRRQGVYDIRLELSNRSLTHWSSPRFDRTMQVVVLDGSQADHDSHVLWSQVGRIQTASTLSTEAPEWRQKLTQLSSFAPRKKPLGNEKRQVISRDDREMLQLKPGGWVAMPIPTESLNRPHLIEVEYLHAGPMRLGISVLQPDQAGQISTFGIDSGVVVPETAMLPDTIKEPRIEKHRLIVWPRHRNPLLLFANRDPDRSATIGDVRVLAGPTRLASARRGARQSDRRHYLAYLEKPLFAEQFGGQKWPDPESGQLLDDWKTFHTASTRLVQHLKANGYTGLAVTVLCDGSVLYPSEHFKGTAKYDSGRYWSTGQDVLPKDVLEMLFRICDREQIELIPVLELAAPIPELEKIRSLDPRSAIGLNLVDYKGRTAKRQIPGQLAVYNPLDERVQQAVIGIAKELASRYASHDSFTGMGIKLAPECLLPLPGPQWGLDPRTIDRFATDRKIELDNESAIDFSDIRHRVLTELGGDWLDWRASQIENLFTTLQNQLASHRSDARLLLIPIDLYHVDEARTNLSPSPRKRPDMGATMLRMGLRPSAISLNPQIELLRPHRVAYDHTLAERRLDLHLAGQPQVEAFFDETGKGSVFVHRHRWTHFAQLEKLNPFGEQNSDLLRLQPLSPAGMWNRRRFANTLYETDALTVLDGGWLLPSGQHSAIGGTVDVFTQLPNAKFVDVKPADGSAVHRQLAVRQLATRDGVYFYVTNPNPWKVDGRLVLNRQGVRFESLSDRVIEASETAAAAEVQLTLEPYETVGARVGDPDFRLLSYSAQVDDAVVEGLRRQLDQLLAKASRANLAPPWDVLRAASFEANAAGAANQPWKIEPRNQQKVSVEQASDAKQGSQVLSMQSDGPPVWIRSQAIPNPVTGRLSVVAWIRNLDPQRDPKLRISIDAKHRGRSFYRYALVGELATPTGAQPNWRRFAVHFEDLPINGLTDLKIGFDLMGPGHVQIDEVQLYDRWLDDQDASALTQRFALARYRLKTERDLSGCREILEQYWALFVEKYFSDNPSDQGVENATDRAANPGSANPGAGRDADDSSTSLDETLNDRPQNGLVPR